MQHWRSSSNTYNFPFTLPLRGHTDLSAPSKSLVNAAFKMAFWPSLGLGIGNRILVTGNKGIRESVESVGPTASSLVPRLWFVSCPL